MFSKLSFQQYQVVRRNLISPFKKNFNSISDSKPDRQNIIILKDFEKKQLKKIFSKIEYDPRGAFNYILELRKAAYNNFPTRLLKVLECQKTGLDIKPYISVANLPFDETSGSPVGDESSLMFKKTYLSENLNVSLSAIIGEPYSVIFEGKDLVNNLVPHKKHEKEYTGLGSGVELDLHIENAALKYHKNGDMSPTGLTLSGVRHDNLANPSPKTRICDARLALEGLKDYEKEILRGDNYKIKVPMRWRDQANQETSPSPILRGCIKQPEIAVAFYPDMVKPISKEASEVLEKFYNNAKNVSEAFDIKPGTIFYVDNRFTLHSRDKFNANYDENGRALRWVQRCFVKDSLWSMRFTKKEKDRILNPSKTELTLNNDINNTISL
jgi:L-asparagine oxygenase